MDIQLYLRSINQEMIDAGRNAAPGSLEWVVSWPKECCIINFSRAPLEQEVVLPVTRGFMMRNEPDGGMLWDPNTGAVYKADEEAYHALLDLDQGFSEREVARRLKTTERAIKELIRKLPGVEQG